MERVLAETGERPSQNSYRSHKGPREIRTAICGVLKVNQFWGHSICVQGDKRGGISSQEMNVVTSRTHERRFFK